jgi:hypothetical protein
MLIVQAEVLTELSIATGVDGEMADSASHCANIIVVHHTNALDVARNTFVMKGFDDRVSGSADGIIHCCRFRCHYDL